MRNLFFTFLFLTLGTNFLSAQENDTFTLTIETEITKYNEGSIFVALYDSKETYMKEAVKSLRVDVKDNKAILTIEGLEKGAYGFSMFHDVNNNKKLDKNFIGIPKEPYTFSNDEAGRFGPPNFDKIKFDISENKTISVSIK